MSSVVISGDTSGTVSIAAPAVAGSNTLTLLAATATNSVNTLSTAVASTSGGNIDFTNLPSWVKRITIMFHNVSMSATNNVQVQLGTGSTTFTTSGYGSIFSILGASSVGTAAASSGFVVAQPSTAASVFSGSVVISNLTANTWTEVGNLGETSGTRQTTSTGSIALGAALTAVRITSTSTDTFDAGTINILYEG